MLIKQMRILIADPDHAVRFHIERMLNQKGCYGVALVGTVAELVQLLDYPSLTFDLVLVNYDCLDLDGAATLENLQRYRNVVMYRHTVHSGFIADPLAQINEGLCGLPSTSATWH